MNMYLQREIEKEIQEGLEQFPVLLITGSRQTGKSTLLAKLLPNYEYVSMDDPLLKKEALDDPDLFLKKHPAPLIIDEIQYVPKLLSYIKMVVDQNRRQCGQYILTGSQVFSMMHGVSESLAGRIGIYELYPLSWHELGNHEATKKHLPGDIDCTKHLFQGFYPEIYSGTLKIPNRWMASYFATYVERDVRHIKAIGDLARFESFIALLATRAGQVLNLSKIATQAGISQPTARTWISILESTYIIHLLRPYHKNTSKRVRKAPKLYFADTGLLCYLLGLHSSEELSRSSHLSHIFENMVIMEVIKRTSTLPRRITCSYWNPPNCEVDLIVETGNHLFAFEIKHARTLHTRQYESLNLFKADYKNAHLFLLSLQDKHVHLSKEIQAIHWSEAFSQILNQ